MSNEIELASNNTYDKIDKIEEVGLYSLKGYKNSEIADITGLDRKTIASYIKQYKEKLESIVDDNPYFLEQVQLNTLKALAELDEISKESWETVEIATREGMTGARTQALKLCLDISSKKAAVLQLLGGQKSDGDYIARMQKAETVNLIISNVLRDVIAHCDNCSKTVTPMLNEAFAMMEDETETTE